MSEAADVTIVLSDSFFVAPFTPLLDVASSSLMGKKASDDIDVGGDSLDGVDAFSYGMVGTRGSSDVIARAVGLRVGLLDDLVVTSDDGGDVVVDKMSEDSPLITNGKVPSAP